MRRVREGSVEVRQRTIAIGGVALLLVVLAGGVLLLRGDGPAPATTTAAPAAPAVASPYDLTEAADELDRSTLAQAKFASLLLETPDGATSYMVAAGNEPFAALADAVAGAVAVEEPAPDTVESLTFVMPDRVTVTFALDAAGGLIARGDTVWRMQADVEPLVRAIVEQAAPSG